MKKILFFFINPSFLISAICIGVIIYLSGVIDIFKTYERHKVNVCIRSLDLKKFEGTGLKTDNNILRFFEVCGFLKDEIENYNQPGTLSNGQKEVSANRTTVIKCLVSGPSSYRENKLKQFANFEGKCKVEDINKWNNGDEIYKINKGLNKPLVSK